MSRAHLPAVVAFDVVLDVVVAVAEVVGVATADNPHFIVMNCHIRPVMRVSCLGESANFTLTVESLTISRTNAIFIETEFYNFVESLKEKLMKIPENEVRKLSLTPAGYVTN